jgi:hypothetical protein
MDDGSLIVSGGDAWIKSDDAGGETKLYLSSNVNNGGKLFYISAEDASTDQMEFNISRYTHKWQFKGGGNTNGEHTAFEIYGQDSTAEQDYSRLRLFSPDGTTRAQIHTSGSVYFNPEGPDANFGIGTASPDSKLHISYSDSTTEGDLKNNFNDVGLQIENTHADGCASIQLRSSDADGYIFYDDTGANAGDMHFRTDGMDSLSSLTLKDDGKVGVGIEAPTTTLDVEGTVSYKHISITAGSDNLDVSGCTVVEATPSGTDRLGGLTGGVQGQVIHIVKVDSGFGRLVIEHNEGTGNQDIFLSGATDVQLSTRGGITLYCNGTSWFALDK